MRATIEKLIIGLNDRTESDEKNGKHKYSMEYSSRGAWALRGDESVEGSTDSRGAPLGSCHTPGGIA